MEFQKQQPAAAKRNRVQRLIYPSKDMLSAVAGLINLQSLEDRFCFSSCSRSNSAKFVASVFLAIPVNLSPILCPIQLQQSPRIIYVYVLSIHLLQNRTRTTNTVDTTEDQDEARWTTNGKRVGAVIPKSHPRFYCIIIITRNKIKVINFINLLPFFSHLPGR